MYDECDVVRCGAETLQLQMHQPTAGQRTQQVLMPNAGAKQRVARKKRKTRGPGEKKRETER